MIYDPHLDSYLSHGAAVAALRLRAVTQGAAPRENEPVDLLLLMALHDAPDCHAEPE